MVNRGIHVSLFIVLALLLTSALVAAGSVTVELLDQVQSQVGADGRCGRSSDSGSSLADCSTNEFQGAGPGGCAVSIDGHLPGCYFWEPSPGQKVMASSKVKINAPNGAVGTLHVWTGNFGGGTVAQEQVDVYVNGKKVGTTDDPFCNDENDETCDVVGPVRTDFKNVKLNNGVNNIGFVAVKGGDSVFVNKYKINFNENECPNGGVKNTCTDYNTCGSYQTCDVCPSAPAEICNDKDDNCNGQVDEGLTCEAVCGDGICASNEACEWNGALNRQMLCDGNASPVPSNMQCASCQLYPLCGNGQVDPGEDCEVGQTQEVSCGTDTGVCSVGTKTRTCTSQCTWGDFCACSGVGPSTEVCNNLDDDCDGQVDEGLSCGPVCGNGHIDPGEECEIGDVEARTCGSDVGACMVGQEERTCEDDCTWSDYSVCSDIGPTTEICNGIDDDCDGQTDEGQVCGPICGDGHIDPGEQCELGQVDTQSCGTDEGVCTIGEKQRGCLPRTCQWGPFSTCNGVPPSTEVCDSLDNDCDGSTDENVTTTCVNYATCQPYQTCNAYCPSAPAETCNGIDDNCNGQIDEGDVCPQNMCGNGHLDPGEQCEIGDDEYESCGSDVGACVVGMRERECSTECTWEEFSVCTDIGPTAEVCNGIDDDCDGQTDEGLSCGPVCGNGVVETGEQCEIGDSQYESCGTDVGVCTVGMRERECTNTCMWEPFSVCTGVGPSTEVCDSLDNDCDGSTDEGVSRTCTNYATCQQYQTCNAYCPTAPAETCNNVDDDCDGQVDEGLVCHPVCGNGIIESGEECEIGDSESLSCGTNEGVCTVGEKTRTCSSSCSWNQFSACSGIGPSTEVCDELDNDCDGNTDENVTRTCTDYNTCRPVEVCASSCPVAPTEVCNHVDDDCDGQVDEGNVCAPVCGNGVVEAGEECERGDTQARTCGTDVGACTVGTQTRSCKNDCSWNEYSVCSGVNPSTEVCDESDNDCDGSTDEGVTRTCTNYNTCQPMEVCALSCPAAPLEVCNGLDDNCDGQVDEGVDGNVQDDYTVRGHDGTIDYIGPFSSLETDYLDFSANLYDVTTEDFRGYVAMSVRGINADGKLVTLRMKGQPTDIVQNTCGVLDVENVWWSQNTYQVTGSAPQTVTFDSISYQWDRTTNTLDMTGVGPQLNFSVSDVPIVCLNCQ